MHHHDQCLRKAISNSTLKKIEFMEQELSEMMIGLSEAPSRGCSKSARSDRKLSCISHWVTAFMVFSRIVECTGWSMQDCNAATVHMSSEFCERDSAEGHPPQSVEGMLLGSDIKMSGIIMASWYWQKSWCWAVSSEIHAGTDERRKRQICERWASMNKSEVLSMEG